MIYVSGQNPIMQQRTMHIDIDLENLAHDPTWPTQRMDLAAALGIIARHQALSGGEIRLIEDWGEGENEDIWVKLPEWVMELTAHYRTIHGPRAEEVMSRVMRTLFPFGSVH